jgi:hypothetical protein
MAAAKEQNEVIEKKSGREEARRTRRKENGMAATAGVSRAHRGEEVPRTMSLVRAALALWEAKHGAGKRSVWQRRASLEAE